MQKLKLISLISVLTAALLLSACSFSKAEELYNEGRKLYEQGDYEAACEKYADAISRNRQSGHFFIDYGYALLMLKDYSEALANFSYAIAEERDIVIVKENNKRALRGAGIACFMLKNYEAAEDYFCRALEIELMQDYNKDILYYLVCTRAEKLESYELGAAEFVEELKALEQNYEELLLLETNNKSRLELMSILSEVYVYSNEFEKAKRVIDESLAHGAEPSAELYIRLASCNIMIRAYSEAEVCIYKALQLDDGSKQEQIEALLELIPRANP